jgi:predicted Zn-dependent protease
MKVRWLIATLAIASIGGALIGCTRQLSPEPSCNFVQNSDLRRVSWKELAPVKLYIHKSLPLTQYPEMEGLVKKAVGAWNQVLGRDAIHLEAFGVGGSDMPQRDGYSMIYWLNTWEAGRQNEQARTTIYWTGARIEEADMRINSKDHRFYVGAEETFSGVDFLSLIVHELGHVLGLAHNSTPKSVMNISLSDGLDRRAISKADVDSARCEY